MDMEKSASRFKFFDTARNFGCIFFVKMNVRHIAFKQRKKGRCNMPYLYHVTTEENAKSILKNGLIPKIGERSQLVGETEKYVYLCGRKDVPFWSLILDKPVVLRVEMKDGEVHENNVYQYSYYSEILAETAIPAERIRKSRVSRSLTNEQMKDLALSYVDMISLICVKFAEYITYIDDEPEENAEEDKTAIELTIESLKFTLPHLNFSGINAKMLRDHLHERGDGGCTLCDRYEPNWKEGEKYIRLYDLLNSHPLATDNTKWLYKWLKKTFPRRLRVNTGGWTG